RPLTGEAHDPDRGAEAVHRADRAPRADLAPYAVEQHWPVLGRVQPLLDDAVDVGGATGVPLDHLALVAGDRAGAVAQVAGLEQVAGPGRGAGGEALGEAKVGAAHGVDRAHHRA